MYICTSELACCEDENVINTEFWVDGVPGICAIPELPMASSVSSGDLKVLGYGYVATVKEKL